MEQTKKTFSWRAFISFGLVFAFFIIFISGTVLYIAPKGRVAHWTNWQLMGLLKDEWQSLHTVFSYVFVILGVFHLFSVNWKVFLSYIKTKASENINKKKELVISSLMMIGIFLGVLFYIPPFSSFMELSYYLKDTWEKKDERPPIPHAEQLNLIELANQLNDTSVEQVEAKLKSNNIEYTSTGQTLEEIGKLNGISPGRLFDIISAKTEITGKTKSAEEHVFDGERRNDGTGKGYGRMTVEDCAAQSGMTVTDVLQKLENYGITAQEGQSLREIADGNGMRPGEVYEVIQGE